MIKAPHQRLPCVEDSALSLSQGDRAPSRCMKSPRRKAREGEGNWCPCAESARRWGVTWHPFAERAWRWGVTWHPCAEKRVKVRSHLTPLHGKRAKVKSHMTPLRGKACEGEESPDAPACEGEESPDDLKGVSYQPSRFRKLDYYASCLRPYKWRSTRSYSIVSL